MRSARISAVLVGFSIIVAPLVATAAIGSGQDGGGPQALGVAEGRDAVLPNRDALSTSERLSVPLSNQNMALALDGRGWVSLPTEVIETLRAFSGPVTIEICMRWREFRKWSRAWDFGSDAGAVFLGNTGVESTLVTCFTGIRDNNVFACSLPLNEWVTIAAVWDAEVFRLYVDGKQVYTQVERPAAFPPSAAGYFLGNSNWRVDELLFGDIDAFSIKKGALYVRDYEPKPLAADGESLLFYGFEGIGDAVVMDTSGNGNHGLLKGAWRFMARPQEAPELAAAGTRSEGGAPTGDAWGRVGRALLQAGIRVVDSGAALEVVLRNTNSGVCEIEAKQPWVFHFRGKEGVVQHFQPERLPGMEGRIILREGETRRGKIRIRDISSDVDLTKECEVWVTWGSERSSASREMSVASGVVTVKKEKSEEVWQSEERERMWSSLRQQTAEGRREIPYGTLCSRELRLVFEKPGGEWANATWGAPEAGMRAGIILDTKSLRASDEFEAELVLENVGEADLAWWRLGSFPYDWLVNVTRPDGKKVERTEFWRQMYMRPYWGREYPVLFRVGELARVRIPITGLFVLNTPGDYELSVAASGHFEGGGGEKTRSLCRSSVKFTVQE